MTFHNVFDILEGLTIVSLCNSLEFSGINVGSMKKAKGSYNQYKSPTLTIRGKCVYFEVTYNYSRNGRIRQMVQALIRVDRNCMQEFCTQV